MAGPVQHLVVVTALCMSVHTVRPTHWIVRTDSGIGSVPEEVDDGANRERRARVLEQPKPRQLLLSIGPGGCTPPLARLPGRLPEPLAHLRGDVDRTRRGLWARAPLEDDGARVRDARIPLATAAGQCCLEQSARRGRCCLGDGLLILALVITFGVSRCIGRGRRGLGPLRRRIAALRQVRGRALIDLDIPRIGHEQHAWMRSAFDLCNVPQGRAQPRAPLPRTVPAGA